MRRVLPVLVALALLAGCSGGDDEKKNDDVTAASLGLSWPSVADGLTIADQPAVPEGFDETRYARMVDALISWAQATTADPDVRGSDDPVAAVAAAVPEAIGKQIVAAAKDSPAPHLAAANVFAPTTKIVGDPVVTTAWKALTEEADGEPALRLQLQTRAAYTVQDGDGPKRVVGVLRVHELITREGEKGGIGVGFSWQEFGASDCTVALKDALRPDGESPTDEIATFTAIGSGTELSMPELPVEGQVDDDFLDRCKRGTT